MDKHILYQYIDACELIKETEEELEKLRRRQKEVVTDRVRGSSYDFPFGMMSYVIRGIPDDELESKELERKAEILEERKKEAEAIKTQVDAWMNTISMRMKRIIKYRIFEKMSWNKVARRMGREATADGVRMEFCRFMEKI